MTTARPQPNVEERLAAAAFNILTDDNPHRREAKLWALRFLDRSAMGRSTAFQRQIKREAIRLH